MNVPLQVSIADEFFRSGYYTLRRKNVSEEAREQAFEDLKHAKETFQRCLDSGSPDLNARLKRSIERRIIKIREVLVESVLPDFE